MRRCGVERTSLALMLPVLDRFVFCTEFWGFCTMMNHPMSIIETPVPTMIHRHVFRWNHPGSKIPRMKDMSGKIASAYFPSAGIPYAREKSFHPNRRSTTMMSAQSMRMRRIWISEGFPWRKRRNGGIEGDEEYRYLIEVWENASGISILKPFLTTQRSWIMFS